MPGGQHQQDERQELGQANEPQEQRVAGDVVDLEPPRHDEHLAGHRHHEARHEIAAEVDVRHGRRQAWPAQAVLGTGGHLSGDHTRTAVRPQVRRARLPP